MTVLEIQGRKVEVGPEFLQLSPEMQQQTVNEIAAKMNAAPPQIAAEQPTQANAGGGEQNFLQSATTAGQDALTFGFGDEITAGALALPDAGIRYLTGQADSFSPGESYTRRS